MRRLCGYNRGRPYKLGRVVPDLPVCFATGATREEVRARIEEGIRLYLDSLRSGRHGRPRRQDFCRGRGSRGLKRRGRRAINRAAVEAAPSGQRR